MHVPDWKTALAEAFDQATDYLAGLPDRPVGRRRPPRNCKEFGGPLPEHAAIRGWWSSSPPRPSEACCRGGSERFFGFVFGGAIPAALARTKLTVAWGQNAVRRGAGRRRRGRRWPR